MDHPIKRDHNRFKKIVKGKIKENLRKYVSQGEMISPKGNGKFKIPMPQIEIPRFKFGDSQGGTGQGDGQPGDPVDGQEGEGQEGDGKAGQDEGNKELEVELDSAELAQILGDELELPNIEPKGKKQIQSTTEKYTSIGNVGPDSLRHVKRTLQRSSEKTNVFRAI